jgi:hypothetical protein
MFHSIATGKNAYRKSEPISNAEKAYPSLVIDMAAMQVPVPEAGFHARLSGRHWKATIRKVTVVHRARM